MRTVNRSWLAREQTPAYATATAKRICSYLDFFVPRLSQADHEVLARALPDLLKRGTEKWTALRGVRSVG